MLQKLHHNPLASRQCVSCPPTAPICQCSTGQSCILTSQSCSSCAVATCVDDAHTHPPSSGISKGPLAGAIVGVLVFLLLVVGGFLWWRRRSSIRNTAASNREKITAGGQQGSAPASGVPVVVIRAPDAIEKGTIPEDGEVDPNPFTDAASSKSGQSIPIALEGNSSPPHTTSPTGTTFTAPARPPRSPELSLRNGGGSYFDRPTSNLEPPRPGYAPSQRSGFTVSTIDSTASSAMAALYESPTIVSAGSRQVLGAVRAEVVQVGAGGLSPSGVRQPLQQQQRRSQLGPSPLSSSHFTGRFPTIEEDPFSDQSKRIRDSAATDLTFGEGSATPSTSRNITSPRPGHGGISPVESNHSLESSAHTETQNDHANSIYGSTSRRTSRESVLSSASRTDSVLANFPFVPPSPLPSTRNRSPLSVVFGIERQSTSSAHIADAPPLPTHHNVAEKNRSRTNLAPPSPISLSMVSPTETDPLPLPSHRVVSTMSQASTSSTGLDAFHFQFAPEGEAPLPLPNPAFYNDSTPRDSLHTPSTPVLRPEEDLTSSSLSLPYENSNASNSYPADPSNQRQTRASLDTLELSRDLTANRLSYD